MNIDIYLYNILEDIEWLEAFIYYMLQVTQGKVKVRCNYTKHSAIKKYT